VDDDADDDIESAIDDDDDNDTAFTGVIRSNRAASFFKSFAMA
jgi:hypothetical protein